MILSVFLERVKRRFDPRFSLPGFSSLGTHSLTDDESLTLSLSDAIVANNAPGTDVLLTYGAADAAAVGRDNGVYRSAYFGFPFMALPSGEARKCDMGSDHGECPAIRELC